MTRRYFVRFADGKSATVIDTEATPPDQIVAAIHAQFSRPGYVLEVVKC
ncbi:hypothetical protein JR044_31155 [Pseudomonas aeruginosa]|nr:hypothetical protein [Pseudomonas aeruginosa]MBS9758454.1 hypothetical protein [Pseudomonas aeruginosa]